MARKLHAICIEISRDWKNVWFGAQPYLAAMGSLETLEDKFGCDDGEEIVRRFLANAGTWRGETARRVKKELNEMLKTSG